MAAPIRYWLSYLFFRKIMLGKVKIEVNGLNNLPENQGFIIASNHEHSWDPILMMAGIKKLIHYFSIESNFTRPLSNSVFEKVLFNGSLAGTYQRFMQQIPVSYKSKEMNKKAFLKAGYYLRQVEIVGIFPEGMLEMKKRMIFPGVAVLAKRSRAKILPVYIHTNAPCDSPLKPNFTKVDIRIGRPLAYARSVEYTKNNAIKEIRKLK